MSKSNQSQATSMNHSRIEDLRIDDLEAGSIKGGIDTVPLPERPSSSSKLGSVSNVMIGTWPQPDAPRLSFSSIRR